MKILHLLLTILIVAGASSCSQVGGAVDKSTVNSLSPASEIEVGDTTSVDDPLADILAAVVIEKPVSFTKTIMPVLKRRCAACHIMGTEPGKMALIPSKAYEFIVNVDSVEVAMKRIAPGEPEKSYLLHKLQGTHLDVGGMGSQMPLHQGPLPLKDLNNFRLWIEQGAQNN